MSDPVPPAWVRKRDGRTEPFQPDRIGRALFAVTEEKGRPDAFLARELAEGVLHFLAEDGQEALPTSEVAEVVVRVVRELGWPALAEAFARGRSRPAGYRTETPAVSLAEWRADGTRAYARQMVFSRDLMAAHDTGLLRLGGLEAPDALVAWVPRLAADDLPGGLADLRDSVKGWVALDGLEHLGIPPASLAQALALAARYAPARLVANLNGPPPVWADALAHGPLFAGQGEAPDVRGLADDLFDALICVPGVRIDWHLSARDLEEGERLVRLARRALDGGAVAFVFDRPRRPVALGEGLDRTHSAVLLAVGLDLPALAAQQGMVEVPRFLQRLGTLARLARSAAAQKRDFLRRHPAPLWTSGFVLERARLVLVPLGLDRAVRSFHSGGMTSDEGAALARDIVRRLAEVLREESRRAPLEACLDGPADFTFEGHPEAGLTPWSAAPVRAQLRAADGLHGAAGGGALALLTEGTLTAGQLAEALRRAWQRTDIVRLRLARPGATQRELWS